MIKAHRGNQIHGCLEIHITFAREADYKIRRNADVRPYLSQLSNRRFVFQRGVFALHQGQDAIRPALHRQMQVPDQFRHLGIDLYQTVAHFQWV